jgi:anti-anti-sigma factor
VPGGDGEPRFHLRVEEREGRRWVVVLGDLDLEAGARVEPALADARERGAETVVDLRGVELLDSSRLRVLLEASLRVREGAPPVYVLARGQPRRLIALTGLEGPLVVHPDEQGLPAPPSGG